MFNFNLFKVPSYDEYKEQVSKFWNDVFKFYKDFSIDIDKNIKKDG
jgi:hypothetical protein